MFRIMTLSLITLLVAQQWAAAGEAKRPNVVIVLADDMGWRDTGYSGNKVVNSTDKSYVRSDSLTDIQERVTASKDLCVSFQTKNDVLLLKIAQDDGTLSIALPGFADDYKATFDDSLF